MHRTTERSEVGIGVEIDPDSDTTPTLDRSWGRPVGFYYAFLNFGSTKFSAIFSKVTSTGIPILMSLG